MECTECGFIAKSAAGLGNHRRAKHPVESMGANARALEVTIAELQRMGRIELFDSARVQAMRSMAKALDDNPIHAQMWRAYREALEGFTGRDDDDGGIEAALAKLQAAPRNAAPG